jgi:hypothetical protein
MGFDLGKLGVKRNIPKVNFLEYTGIFEAPEKFGKTALASLFPKSILLAAEVGYKAQVLDYKNITKWDDFVEFIDLLEENREEIGEDIQTIVIDTIDELHPMAAPYMLKKQSIKDKTRYLDVKDVPYGQGWNYWDQEFKSQIKRIHNLGFSILYLTHSIVKQVKPKNGEPYDVYKSTMSDRCAAIVYPACDYIIHGERRMIEENGKNVLKRALVVRGNDEAVAGNRVYFDEDIIFDTEEEAMAKFQEKFLEGIQRNLAKAKVSVDISQLSKQQEVERQERVKEYIETVKETPSETTTTAEMVVNEINQLIDAMKPITSEQKQQLTSIFTQHLNMTNYKKSIDVAALQKCVVAINGM